MQQIKVGVRETKANLSKLLARVKIGYVVIITDRGKPVAKLECISKKLLSLEERIREMEEKGRLEPQKKKYDSNEISPIVLRNCIAQQFLQEDRGE